MKKDIRCAWPGNDERMLHYHDHEWGVPVHDDQLHFEYIILDGFQAGLSWKTILHRREHFRKAFAGFDVQKVARFTPKKIEQLLLNEGIIRNRLKVQGAVKNAKAFIQVQKEFGSFDAYIWQFTKGKIIDCKPAAMSHIPSSSVESDAMSKDLKRRGFTFVGTTICYAYMQAAGMVNDHVIGCKFRKRTKQNSLR
ncbi:MAG: DNA-3-methyladenine glycosylase I [Bacteroidia bacterium]|jgi:DNA-3-methyladenine glycosylase I